MKRVYMFIALVVALSFFVCPNLVKADSDGFYYSNIEDKNSLFVGKVDFLNIVFEEYSNLEFGVAFDIENISGKGADCEIIIKLYDEAFQLVHSNTQNLSISEEKEDQLTIKSQLGNKDSKYTLDDIKYYSVSIDVSEKDSVPSVVGQEIPSKTGKYDSYDYLIDGYDIDIVVGENNVLEVTEKLKVYFNVRKHGIFRRIPLVNDVTRLDGSKSTVLAKIYDISVNEPFHITHKGPYREIKVGEEDKLLTGEKEYTIKYKYDLGPDKNAGFDEFYFNLIGTEWNDTVIGGVQFSITMPKSFEKSGMGFSHGKKGSIESEKVDYTVDGNVISGVYKDIMQPNEAFTVRIVLEDGYFHGSAFRASLFPILMIVIPVVGFILCFVLWAKYGKDDPIVETVEFYPPQGMNSLDLAYAYKGQVDGRDVISLLVYLANKGYIKITEIEVQKFIVKEKSFRISKVREYDGNDANERTFLNGLFATKTSYRASKEIKSGNMGAMLPNGEVQVNSVSEEDLYDNFYRTIHRIKKNVCTRENKYRYFEKIASKKSFLVLFILWVSIFFFFGLPCYEFGAFAEIIRILPLLLIVIVASLFLVLPFRIFEKIFGFGLFMTFATITSVLSSIWFSAIVSSQLYVIATIIGAFSIFGMVICFIAMPKRSKMGSQIYGQIMGFKRFLETVKKEQIESLVMQNPNYFYDILPYTYVLGISDKWIKKFETIALRAPDWYDGYDSFDTIRFGAFMNTTMSSARSSSSSSSGSSGGSSGGGSSGGGSGGGGGGSW